MGLSKTAILVLSLAISLEALVVRPTLLALPLKGHYALCFTSLFRSPRPTTSQPTRLRRLTSTLPPIEVLYALGNSIFNFNPTTTSFSFEMKSTIDQSSTYFVCHSRRFRFRSYYNIEVSTLRQTSGSQTVVRGPLEVRKTTVGGPRKGSRIA